MEWSPVQTSRFLFLCLHCSLNTNADGSSEPTINLNHATYRHIPEASVLQTSPCECLPQLGPSQIETMCQGEYLDLKKQEVAGGMRRLHTEDLNHLRSSPYIINTFAASYLNTQGLNNSCLKSPASTWVDLTFQSRTLRSFSLNQLRNLSL